MKDINNIIEFILGLINTKSLLFFGSLTILLILITTTVSSGQKAIDNYTEKAQAYYVAKGGAEYAKYLLKNERSPEVQNKDLGEGSFSVGLDIEQDRLIVSGQVNKTAIQLLEELSE